MDSRARIVILGAGPAGLGAAFRLASRGCFDVTVVERNAAVGGNAGSFEIAGLRVDFGSHRLHPSCPIEILTDIRSLLGEELFDRPRHGRMRLCGRWVHFPLKPANVAANLPISFSLGVARDAAAKMAGDRDATTFQAVLERGLGSTICREFYFPYARKIWGVDPSELDAEQARRRVSAGSLSKMARKLIGAVPGFKPVGGGRFYYPKNGFGAISEAYRDAALDRGAQLLLGTHVAAVDFTDSRLSGVRVNTPDGPANLGATQVLSTIPLPCLVAAIQPAPPAEILASASALRFRAMVLAYLVLDTDRFTEFDAHYFPAENIPVSRLSEPKNYGQAQTPGRTVICAELPCSIEDPVWRATDAEVGDMVARSLADSGLKLSVPVLGVCTRRLPQAYPIYTRDYRHHFDRLDNWTSSLAGLVTFGRQGLFAHDNTHHTLAMAYAASDCLDDRGSFDHARWQTHRQTFASHVVED